MSSGVLDAVIEEGVSASGGSTSNTIACEDECVFTGAFPFDFAKKEPSVPGPPSDFFLFLEFELAFEDEEACESVCALFLPFTVEGEVGRNG